MKPILLLTFLFISTTSFAQKLDWIPFNWEGDSISGKYFDKLAITIPVTIDNLPHQFKMQFDLGATTTVIYGNTISAYLDKYSQLKNKIDTTNILDTKPKEFYVQKCQSRIGSSVVQ